MVMNTAVATSGKQLQKQENSCGNKQETAAETRRKQLWKQAGNSCRNKKKTAVATSRKQLQRFLANSCRNKSETAVETSRTAPQHLSVSVGAQLRGCKALASTAEAVHKQQLLLQQSLQSDKHTSGFLPL
jgi:hypothetical protein